MRICLTVLGLAQSSGGPSAVVKHLAEGLSSLGVDVTVLTYESPAGTVENCPVGERVTVIKVPSISSPKLRLTWGKGYSRTLERACREAEVALVHDFGLWMPANHHAASVASRFGVPFLSSPSGMLAPWALRHKAWKKTIAWWLYQRRDLASARVLIVTSEQEAGHIRRMFPDKPLALIPNGAVLPTLTKKVAVRDSSAPRKVVFLGRIYPVKGLLNLVEAWDRVRPEGWRCTVAGPDEAGHQRDIEEALRKRRLRDKFDFPGLLDGEAKWHLLANADLFVLPSYTENFGIAAAEALAAGVPVITTKGTPWEELHTHECGWWIDVGEEPLVAALREAMALSDEQRRNMGARGRRLVQEKYAWPKIARDMRAVYEWVLGGGEQPACVRIK